MRLYCDLLWNLGKDNGFKLRESAFKTRLEIQNSSFGACRCSRQTSTQNAKTGADPLPVHRFERSCLSMNRPEDASETPRIRLNDDNRRAIEGRPQGRGKAASVGTAPGQGIVRAGEPARELS